MLYEVITGSALKNLSTEFMGIVYVAFPFVLSNFIVFAKAEFNYHILLSIFFVRNNFV